MGATSKILNFERQSIICPDLLLEMARYCCPVEIHYFVFLFIFGDITEIYCYFVRPPSRGKCRKVSFSRHNKMMRAGVELIPLRLPRHQ